MGTDLSFGFQTAADIATESLDRIHTTAESHQRVMVVEVMGRNAGWIALHSGVASGSDVILIPEIPYDLEKVAAYTEYRRSIGRDYTVVCISEGAAPKGGQQAVQRLDPTSPDPVKLGGIARQLAHNLQAMTGQESRATVLGHVQRGGSPDPGGPGAGDALRARGRDDSRGGQAEPDGGVCRRRCDGHRHHGPSAQAADDSGG